MLNIIKKIKNTYLNLNYYIFISLRIKNINDYKYIFVTGTDSSHFKSCINCINSIAKNSNPYKIIVWNLGCTDIELDLLKKMPIEIKHFNYQNYPEYYNIKKQAGSYAWKSAIIKNVMDEYNLITIWFDAGNILYKIDRLIKTVIINGFYSPYSSGNIKKWTHFRVLELFKLDKKDYTKRNLNGACVCFNPENKSSIQLLNEWEILSRNKDYIAPDGSSRENHRQDQSLLTILSYQYFKIYTFPHGYLDFSIHNDVD